MKDILPGSGSDTFIQIIL